MPAGGRTTDLVIIGGSFAGGFAQVIADCGLFKSVDMYSYYQTHVRLKPYMIEPVDRKALEWRRILSGQTILVIELNEIFLSGGPPLPWLGPFLDDATG